MFKRQTIYKCRIISEVTSVLKRLKVNDEETIILFNLDTCWFCILFSSSVFCIFIVGKAKVYENLLTLFLDLRRYSVTHSDTEAVQIFWRRSYVFLIFSCSSLFCWLRNAKFSHFHKKNLYFQYYISADYTIMIQDW